MKTASDNERAADVLAALKEKGYTIDDVVFLIRSLNQVEENSKEGKRDPKDYGFLEVRVSDLLRELGMPVNCLGYRYTRTAICMVYEDDSLMGGIFKELYPKVAKVYRTTPSRVERAIRHAIERTFERMNVETYQKYFGNMVDANRGKLTNSEFIFQMANILHLEEKRI